MKCPRCKVEMDIGMAIDAGPSERARAIVWSQHWITAETLKLIPVFKCPECGHSDDGYDPARLFGVIDNR